MADTMKFGPEWLRALSDGNSVTSPPPSPAPTLGTKYKLAEHRYGREEMLALFVPNSKIPDEVKETPSICVEKSQHPLAFMQPCEEEQRLMSQSVNSSVVLRMMGQGRGGPMSRGGRGGPADRGRGLGRGRGRGEGYYQRGPFEDEGFGRGRPRSEAWDDRDKRFDRGFPSKPGFEEGPVSPRRELSRSMSSDNWRDAKKEEDDDGDWRRAGPKDRWGSRSSWRDQPRPYDSDFHGRFNDYSRDPRDRRPAPFDQDRSLRSRSRSTGSWDDDPETLPEWSTTDVEDMGNVGTFDSSGAFMSLKDFGEEDELEGGLTDPQEKSPKEQNRPGGDTGETKENGTAGQEVDKRQSQKAAGSPGTVARLTKDNTKTAPAAKGKVPSGKEGTPDRDAADADKPAAIKSSVKGEGRNTNRTGRGDSFVNSAHSVATIEGQRADPGTPISMETKTASSLVSSAATTTSVTVNAQLGGAGVQSVRLGAPPPAQNGATGGATVTAANIDSHNSARATPGGTDSRAGSQQAGQGKTRPDEDADFDHLEKAAESLVATMDDEEVRVENVAKVEQGALSMDHEDAKKWFYKDPQGDLQGPFSAAEMSEWFSAGYFTMNLLVKRGCDDTFQPLGELIKAWGRVPFLPGPALPPLKSTPQSSAVVNPISAVGSTPPTTAAGVGTPEQLKVLQHQVLMQQQLIQQQALLRQLQLQQILQSIQQQPAFAKLSPQEQQHLALQLLIKQQTGMFQQQQQQQQQQAGGPDAQQVTSQQTPSVRGGGSPQPQPEQPLPMKLSPRSGTGQEEVVPPGGGHINHPGFHRSLSQPGHNTAPDFHRSMSTPSGEQASLWGAAPGMPAPPSADGGSSWSQSGGSVWDIEPQKPAEDAQRAELERIQREQEEREQEERRKEEERRQLEEEDRRRREHDEMQRQQEMERQKEMERQREIERQNEIKKQELERQEMERQELERQRMEQLRREQEIEERRRREEDERRQRQEEEERERRRIEELQRLEEERKRRGAEDQMEKKRQEEIRRRQEKEELRRQQQQQQEALRRMQQEQMAKMQLPATAQWASGPVTSSPSALSLAQIQQLEAETERKEQIERQRKLEAQRQQLAAIQQQQQQQQQQNARWSNAPSGAPSLLDIQQEQARQQHDEIHRQQQQPQPSLPLSSAAVWGNNAAPSSHWATEGAWGNNPQNSSSLGFWDDAVNVSNKKTSVNNNAHFPSLTPSVQPNASNIGANRARTTKAKKEEESVQRLFNAMKPTDEFTQWCENALRGMQTSVDIPTFIAFLLEVESAYEVHDYVRSYLGEGREAEEFARVFLEKRRKHRNHMTQQRQDDFVWNTMPSADSQCQGQVVGEDEFRSVKSKKKSSKKKMQKLDSSILGFTVHAAPDRIVGEIETGDKV